MNSHSGASASPLPIRSLSASHTTAPGASPPSRGGSPPTPCQGPGQAKDARCTEAKKFWSRLRFDPNLNASDFTVGFAESREEHERRSGKEAWSARLRHVARELPYHDFAARFPDAVPFHRILYFKERGVVVWEQRALRRVDLPPGEAASLGVSPPAFGSSPLHSASSPGAPKLSSPSHAWPRDPASSSSTCQDRGTPRSPPAPGGLSSAFGGLSLARTPPSRASSTVAHSRHVSLLTDPSEAWVDGPSPPLSSDGELSAAEADKAPACPELPDECWLLIMEHVGVRELCALARTCQELRRLSADRRLWLRCHERVTGQSGDHMDTPALKRACRKSELQVARWSEAPLVQFSAGFAVTSVLQVDGTTCVSGDGTQVRLWSHATGERIATLPGGHGAPVTSLTFNDHVVLTGDAAGTVKLWTMDDLRLCRQLRGHEGSVVGAGLVGETPVTASQDGTIRWWDTSTGHAILALETHGATTAMATDLGRQRIVTAGDVVEVWDAAAGASVTTLLPSAGSASCVALDSRQQSDLLVVGAHGALEFFDCRAGSSVASLAVGGGGPPVGALLHGWRLMAVPCAASDVLLYDVRALASRGAPDGPLMSLRAEHRVTAFAHAASTVVAAHEAPHLCTVWEVQMAWQPQPIKPAVGQPTSWNGHLYIEAQAGYAGSRPAGTAADEDTDEGWRRKERKERRAARKVSKPQNKYPKRHGR